MVMGLSRGHCAHGRTHGITRKYLLPSSMIETHDLGVSTSQRRPCTVEVLHNCTAQANLGLGAKRPSEDIRRRSHEPAECCVLLEPWGQGPPETGTGATDTRSASVQAPLFRRMRFTELTLGIEWGSHILWAKSWSLISHANMPGFSCLKRRIFFTTVGVATCWNKTVIDTLIFAQQWEVLRASIKL
jgi:hypothetical protein